MKELNILTIDGEQYSPVDETARTNIAINTTNIQTLATKDIEPVYYSNLERLSLRESGTIPTYSYNTDNFIEVTNSVLERDNPVYILAGNIDPATHKPTGNPSLLINGFRQNFNKADSLYFVCSINNAGTGLNRIALVEYNPSSEFSIFPNASDYVSGSYPYYLNTGNGTAWSGRPMTNINVITSGFYRILVCSFSLYGSTGKIAKANTADECVNDYIYPSFDESADAIISALSLISGYPSKEITNLRVDDKIYTFSDETARTKLDNTEDWIFTLMNGTTVTKKVVIKNES